MTNNRLTKHFTFEELTHTDYNPLQQKNSDNAIQYRPKLQKLAEFAEQIRAILDCPMIITSGYRCEELNAYVGGSPTSQHCFDTETEILTSDGWKKYNEISKKDKCFSYNLSTQKIELTDIYNIIKRKHNGKMYVADTKDINYCVTDKHRFLVKTNKYQRKTNRIMSGSYHKNLQKPTWQFKTADEIYNKRSIHLVSGISNNTLECNINLLKLCIAVVCDGCVVKRRQDILFTLAKERKIKHVIELLKLNNISYTIRKDNSNYRASKAGLPVYSIYINSTNAKPIVDIIGKQKLLPKDIIMLKPEILKELVYEYAFFDGHIPSDYNNHFMISSANKHNIDLLQIMCIFCDLKATIHTQKHRITGFASNSTYYTLNVSCKKESKISEFSHSQIDYNGIVWCISNKNTTVIARRNGKVIIAGNCFCEAFDFIPKNMDAYQAFAKIIVSNIEYQQLILEKRGIGHIIHIGMGSKRQKLFSPKQGVYKNVL